MTSWTLGTWQRGNNFTSHAVHVSVPPRTLFFQPQTPSTNFCAPTTHAHSLSNPTPFLPFTLPSYLNTLLLTSLESIFISITGTWAGFK